MSYIDDRIALAADWFDRNLVRHDESYAGWGWSADVPPNPQDTAEVVCALKRVGRPVPESESVLALVRRDVVRHSNRGEWEFHAPVDAAWRLRALRCFEASAADGDVLACRNALLTAQDADTGGWALADGVAAVSVTATTAAIRALVELATDDDEAARAALRGTSFLVSAVLGDDPRVAPNYASAQIAGLLALPEITGLGGARVERAHRLASERVLDCLEVGIGTLEEEQIRRGDVAQTWHHATLQLSVAALATAGERLVFHPTFRRAFVQLLDFQQLSPIHRDRGGFRTSREGFITSYATAQAIHALAQVRSEVGEWVNPATVFDLLCERKGMHHTDPQEVVPMGKRPMVMNSPAGAAFFAMGSAAGITIVTLALLFSKPLGEIASRALVAWGTLFVFLGIYGFAATRLISLPKGKVAAVVFAAFTAIVFPVVAFLLA
ncbi:hypothetical protein ABZV58_33530 [Nocardia sp. NPDC004654]|uniref:hypothetical protein n=1 Tax=Nocardia sp. NPDC004654 TaxID=3154776 RepID=UPI0033BD80AD